MGVEEERDRQWQRTCVRVNCSPHSQGAKEEEERTRVPHPLQRHTPIP
jgi:hypothetical protein